MSDTLTPLPLDNYLTVGKAAEFLGVTAWTLRNWDRAGKLKARRHPKNGYRIYLHEDLEAVLRHEATGLGIDTTLTPRIDWSDMGPQEHFVQLYENDAFLENAVSGFVGAALNRGDAGIIIAKPEHRVAIEAKLLEQGLDPSCDRFISLDAAETLSAFMVDGMPDAQLFEAHIGPLVERLTFGGRGLHAFGEMVGVLWLEGKRQAAIRLEELWNELGKKHRFALYCAYPLHGCAGHHDDFVNVCSCHTRVIPAESYGELTNSDDQRRAITVLQQRAQSLEAEIAHRKEIEKVLSARERELTDFFENATEGIHRVGPDGRIIWANRAELSLLGYSKHEYVGHFIQEFHVDQPVIDEMLAKLRAGESLYNFQARLRCKDGSIRHVLVNSNTCFEDGEFAYTRCFTRDITDRVKAEESLIELDQRKDEFLATLAHELRNPLAPISNALQMMRLAGAQDQTTEEARAIIERQVRQMVRIVDDLLDVSRITRGKLELRKQPVELSEVLKCAVETSQPFIDAMQHQLLIKIPSSPIHLMGDATRLAQVFANLLNNSAKYMDRGGQIELIVEERAHDVVVSVQDSGIGIPPDALPHIFGMFHQVNHALERAQGGLGIGLTLVRKLVELHGGEIAAYSDGVGKGSRFVVTLPRSEPAAAAPAKIAAAAEAFQKHRKRILVVDDNKDSAMSLTTMLQLMGNEVCMAHDGLAAVEIAAAYRPEIIFMDVGMPKLNGYDATRQIRQTPWGQNVHIIALTGWGQNEDVRRSLEAGCTAHLVKPIEHADLQRLLAGSTVL